MLGTNASISSKRLTNANNKESYPATFYLSAIECYLEKARPEVAIRWDGVAAYDIFTAYVEGNYDIIISDYVEDDEGVAYVVGEIQVFKNNSDVPDSMEITLFKKYAGN